MYAAGWKQYYFQWVTAELEIGIKGLSSVLGGTWYFH